MQFEPVFNKVERCSQGRSLRTYLNVCHLGVELRPFCSCFLWLSYDDKVRWPACGLNQSEVVSNHRNVKRRQATQDNCRALKDKTFKAFCFEVGMLRGFLAVSLVAVLHCATWIERGGAGASWCPVTLKNVPRRGYS
jgi:hypothetical protein